MPTATPGPERPLRVRLIGPDLDAGRAEVIFDVPLDGPAGSARAAYRAAHPDDFPDGFSDVARFVGTVRVPFRDLRSRLRDALRARFTPEQIAAHRIFRSELPTLDDGDIGAFFGPLVAPGHEVYQGLFGARMSAAALTDFRPLSPDLDAATAGRLLRESLDTADRRIVFAIPQDDGPEPFPWGFVFDRPPGELRTGADLCGACWGLKYQIETSYPWTQGQSEEREFRTAGRRLVAGVCPTADLDGRHADAGHPFAGGGVAVDLHAERAPFLRALGALDADIVYFFGHAELLAAGEHLMQFRPRGVESHEWENVRVADLAAADLPNYLRAPVLAFLCGCETAPMTRVTAGSLLERFVQRHWHARCVATSYYIPTNFALELAREFWARVLPAAAAAGAPIGLALLRAKQALLAAYNNPLGVLYALFGDGLLCYPATLPAPIASVAPPAA